MAANPYYSIVPCCPEFGTQEDFFIFPDVFSVADGTYTYNGVTTTINGITFESDYCYTITEEGQIISPTYPEAPPNTDFNLVSTPSSCENVNCKQCEPEYYTLNDCCTNIPINWPNSSDGVMYLEYTGCDIDIICASTLVPLIITQTTSKNFPSIQGCLKLTLVSEIPIDAVIDDYYTVIQEVETVSTCSLCQDCSTYYTLNNCCSNVPIEWPEGSPFQGVIYLNLNSPCAEGLCPSDLLPLIITEIISELIDNPITGCLKLTEILESEIPETAEIIPYENLIEGVTTVPECEDCQECPVRASCFSLTNCVTNEVIYSNTVTLNNHIDNVVTLNGYEGCWTVEPSELETCDCPVSVTVIQSFDGCPSCLPTIAYKFTNCDNQSIIRYSTDDYSSYVGKTVKLECGECWFVELINYTPPSTQDIVIENTFSSCVTCNRTYYVLTDCAGVASAIYTYTDLASLVGKSFKIENSTTCWYALELLNPTVEQSSVASAVNVVTIYNDCETCLNVGVCRCSIGWPSENGTLSYIDCTGLPVTLNNLDPDTPSEKLCVRSWLIVRNPIYYGYCVDNECPVEVLPKRKIKPGYSTPTCDPVKYEKISCNASEILYKSVLKNRYGISNCCDELSDKWIIKKELIDLQSKVDSNYVCTPINTCCNTPSCNCGCNTIVSNSCNS